MIDESNARVTARIAESPRQATSGAFQSHRAIQAHSAVHVHGAIQVDGIQVDSAIQIHKRAQFMRLFVVVSTLALAVSNLAMPTLVTSWLGTLTSSPAAYGISLFASCFTFALEISTRLQLGECLRASGLSWDAVDDASLG